MSGNYKDRSTTSITRLQGSRDYEDKLALWHALAAVVGTDPRLGGLDVDELASRAEAQHAQVEARRVEYVRRVLADGRAPWTSGARTAGVMAW